MPEVFNSSKTEYISHTVPVEAGTCVRFSVILHNHCHAHSACLKIHRDGGQEHSVEMPYSNRYDENFVTYSCEYTFENSGLYWYNFEFYGENYQKKIYRSFGEDRLAGDILEGGNSWQITVFDKDYKTPDSYKGGLFYQIFPDRFCNSGAPKSNIPSDRFMQTDWYSQPAYWQSWDANRLCNDYYGGDLKGIEQKLDYLKQLGVTIIYLNPIFEAHSNHRYNTANYLNIDPCLGSDEDFKSLCKSAHKKGIKIILDGVFSHTGEDSVYFNKYRRYDNDGAYNSQNSPYYSWYKFISWPNNYNAWWGIMNLPEVIEETPDFVEFICGEKGVLRHWLRLGADGWRLDVADELPDSFIDCIRRAVKEENPNALLLGEVWENASNKISHGGRRRFLQGKQLDSVMNYPFRSAIINFVTGGSAYAFDSAVREIVTHYPKQSLDVMMNLLGTHDTERILSVLGGLDLCKSRDEQAKMSLSFEQKQLALSRLKLASVLQYTLPGIPSLYYGDEAGVEGMRDPFNRTGYPWGRENQDLLDFYKNLGKIRKNKAFVSGDYVKGEVRQNALYFIREDVLIAVNCGNDEEEFILPNGFTKTLFGEKTKGESLKLSPLAFAIISKE